jgi:hypothetical protein
MGLAEYVAFSVEKRNAYRVFRGKRSRKDITRKT